MLFSLIMLFNMIGKISKCMYFISSLYLFVASVLVLVVNAEPIVSAHGFGVLSQLMKNCAFSHVTFK